MTPPQLRDGTLPVTPMQEPKVIVMIREHAQEGGVFLYFDPCGEDARDFFTGDLLAAYDALRARVAEVEAERDAARVQEALSDAIVDECDSDITTLMQDRAQLRQQLAAAQREGREAFTVACAALAKYNAHREPCALAADINTEESCNCGLDGDWDTVLDAGERIYGLTDSDMLSGKAEAKAIAALTPQPEGA